MFSTCNTAATSTRTHPTTARKVAITTDDIVTAETRASLHDQIGALVEDPLEKHHASQLVDRILEDQQELQESLQNQQFEQEQHYETLLQKRQEVLAQMESHKKIFHPENNNDDTPTTTNSEATAAVTEQQWQQLRSLKQISKDLQSIERESEKRNSKYSDCLKTEIQSNLAILVELIGGDKKKLPWKLQFIRDDEVDQDPLHHQKNDDDLSWSQRQDDVDVVAFNFNESAAGKYDDVPAEYCDTCEYQIGFSDPRWRCMACREVQCDACYTYFHDSFHSHCHTSLPVVLEHIHPSMRELEAALCRNLTETLLTVFQGWSDRPCFCPHNCHARWLTYRQVLDHALRLVTKLLGFQPTEINQVVLCFPAGSMEYYIWDLACLLSGKTTVGMPVPPPPLDHWPPSVTHIVCSEETYQTYKDDIIPSNLKWINAQEATEYSSKLEPYDIKSLQSYSKKIEDDNILCTIFLTSGSTGKPKQIPRTRKYIRDSCFSFRVHREGIRPQCTVSYKPSCWAGDRYTVYNSYHRGGRVGFAPPNPTFPQILDTFDKIKPTFLSLPPSVVQFLCSLDSTHLPSLGGKLEVVNCGSAPISSKLLQELAQKYGIANVREGYGTTEVGGIMLNGWIGASLVNKVRLRDPQRDDICIWLDKYQEGVMGELWIGDHNTQDIVELKDKGRRLKVIGRSNHAATFKLESGKWCAMVDIEDEITRCCCPELFGEVMVWCNRNGMLVMLGSKPKSPCPEEEKEATKTQMLLQEVLRRTNLEPEMRPKALLLTDQPFPKTVTLKTQRSKVIGQFEKKANRVEGPTLKATPIDAMQHGDTTLGVADIAARILGRPVDRSKSFIENGGDSMTAIQWLREIKNHFGPEATADWRALLDDPLQGMQGQTKKQDTGREDINNEANQHNSCDDIKSIDPPPPVDDSAKQILLTGATGFFGKHVLNEILKKDNDTDVVCLVREASKFKIEASERVLVVTSVPQNLKYRLVIHLAANVNHVFGYKALKVDNVDMTEDLLRMRLAPLIYCSTMSTKKGQPPFPDGYSQSKWVSEQMVQRSGGTCFWPPLLVWNNPRDWLTRLLQHCLQTGYYPSSLGYVVACPVEVAAEDLLAGRPCTSWDLDLSELFTRLRIEKGLQPMPLRSFVAKLQSDAQSPAYKILPLLQGKESIRNPRTASTEIFPIDWDQVWPMLDEATRAKEHW